MLFGKTTLNLLTGLLSILIINSVNAQEPCLKVDLQAVSVSPVNFKLDPGKSTQIEVVMRNNGPCVIPKGQATTQITINTEHLEVPANIGFKDECNEWIFVTSTSSGNLMNLFFRNNGADLPVGGKFCAFRFTVTARAKSAGTSVITLASSLSATATTADMNGNNQSAYAEIEIAGKAGEKIPEKKSPVLLNAKVGECSAVLSWEINSDKVDSIEIEVANDKTNFTRTGVVLPNDAKGKLYKYEVEQVNGRRYYRLRVIYKDLTYDYSNTPDVETKCKVKKGF